jgi:hypothetical protein
MCTVKKENPMIKANSARLARSLKLYEGDSGLWTNNAYMVGYLGFSDRTEYLKFLLSPPVLDLFRFSRPYLLSKGWLEVVQFKYRELDPESFGSYQNITKEHPFGGEDLNLSKVLRTAKPKFRSCQIGVQRLYPNPAILSTAQWPKTEILPRGCQKVHSCV